MTISLAVALLLLAEPQQPDKTAPSSAPPDTTVEGVVVSGDRAVVESLIDRRSYAVAADLQAQTGAIADVLRNIPSVQVDLQGNVSLRGDANVTVLVDGKPSAQFSGETLAQALQTLPANQIERIEVMTTPSAEFRADGSGGIINLVMKKARGAGKTASIRTQVGTGGRGLIAGNVGYNADRLSTTADISYRRDAQSLVTANEGSSGPSQTNTDLLRGRLIQEVINAHAGSDYDLSTRTRLSGDLRLAYFHGEQRSLDVFEGKTGGAPIAAFTRLSIQEGWQHNTDATVGLRHTWSETRDLNLSANWSGMSYRRYRADQLTPTFPAGPDRSSAFDRHTGNDRLTIDAAYRTALASGAKLNLGYDFDTSSARFEHAALSAGLANPGQSGVFLDDETRHQVYVTYERAFGKLNTLAGLRADTLHLALQEQSQTVSADRDFDGLYPSLHLSYALAEGRKLTASYSRRVDRPSYALLDPIPYPQNPGFVLQGDINLRPQTTDAMELGFERQKDAATFSATLYHRRTDDAFSSLYANLADGTLLQQIVNAGRQANGGVELALANKLTPTLGYSLSADAHWSELSAPDLGVVQTRKMLTGFGRANLNWQVTPKDFVQLNLFVNGKTLLPQGYVAPFASGNIGYRHAINRNASWMLVIQDPFQSARTKQVLEGFGSASRRLDTANTRMVSLTLVWNFSGKPRDPDFDFKPGCYGGASAP